LIENDPYASLAPPQPRLHSENPEWRPSPLSCVNYGRMDKVCKFAPFSLVTRLEARVSLQPSPKARRSSPNGTQVRRLLCPGPRAFLVRHSPRPAAWETEAESRRAPRGCHHNDKRDQNPSCKFRPLSLIGIINKTSEVSRVSTIKLTVNGRRLGRCRDEPSRPSAARNLNLTHPCRLRYQPVRRLRRHIDGRAVKSCTVLAAKRPFQRHHDRGHSKGDELHPMQAAFRDNHGLQCGYCTPV